MFKRLRLTFHLFILYGFLCVFLLSLCGYALFVIRDYERTIVSVDREQLPLARIVAACAARAIPVGIHASDAAVMPALIEHGIRFLSCDTDTGALIRAWRHAGAAVHAAYEARATDPNAGNTGRN